MSKIEHVVAAVGLCLALTSCQVTVGGNSTPSTTTAGPTVPKRDIEQITAQEIRAQSGGGPIVITCPDDLPVEVGASQQCVLAQDGKHFEVTISISATDSPDDATFDWDVGPEITPG